MCAHAEGWGREVEGVIPAPRYSTYGTCNKNTNFETPPAFSDDRTSDFIVCGS